MPEFKGVENFYLILFFVVPGVVALSVSSRFSTGRIPSLKESILTYVVVSLFYYSITFFAVDWALSTQGSWITQAIAWIGLLLVGPGLFGLLLGAAFQKEWDHWLLDKVGLSIVHVIPTAWDWRFSKMPRNGMFILVTLTNGNNVAGHFGSNSFASSDGQERDLYIEEEYAITEEGKWEPRPEKVGVLIPAREIRHVEFWQP